MTRDPERLLSGRSDADELERELLSSLHHVSPHAHAKDEAWSRIAAQIGAAVVIGGGAAAAASHGAASGLSALGASAKSGFALGAGKLAALKLVVALSLTGVGVGVGILWLGRDHAEPRVDAQPPRSVAPAPAPARAGAPVHADSVSETLVPCPDCRAPSAELGEAVGDAAGASRAPAKRASADDVLVESTRLAEARAELRAGNAGAAASILKRLQADFPKGALGQEREVLAIEVLAARGQLSAAKRRVQAFKVKYPSSPHSAKLARFLDEP